MHLLYVNSYLPYADTEQGTWGRKFVNELRDAGVEVTTVPPYEDAGVDSGDDTPRGVSNLLRIRTLKRYLPARFVHWLIEPGMIVRGLLNTVRLWRLARRIAVGTPDLVYGRELYYDWAPWLIGRSFKRPFVLEVQGLHYFERTFRGLRQSHLLRAFERVQWRRASYLRVASKPVGKLLEEEGVDPSRIRFIPYGVEIRPRPRAISRPGPESAKIAFVGSFYPWHGVETLLRAFALVRQDIPDARLELIGDGLTRVDNERLAAELGIDDAVHFTGWLPRDIMLDRVGASDIAVAPFLTLYYFDPAKVLDYMSTGVAIIASRLDRAAEILQYGRGGALVPPGDAGALAKEVLSLSRDPNRRARLGASAQEILVEEGYSEGAVTESLLALCAKAVDAGVPTSAAGRAD